MKLDTLLNEVRYGKEYVKSKESVSDLSTMMDEDYNILKVSERVSQLLKECDISKSYNKRLARAARNYRDCETKILEGKEISSIYAKMKVDSITEDINLAIRELEQNKKVLRESNKENIAKSIAVLKYGIEFISENHAYSKKALIESTDVIIKNYINKEFELIQNII